MILTLIDYTDSNIGSSSNAILVAIYITKQYHSAGIYYKLCVITYNLELIIPHDVSNQNRLPNLGYLSGISV